MAGLRAGWGLEFRRLLPVLGGLVAGPWTSLTALVEESGATRRAVDSVLFALEPWMERDGERFRLQRGARGEVAGVGVRDLRAPLVSCRGAGAERRDYR